MTRGGGFRLQDKDYQLLAVLSQARCLSPIQLKQLFFFGSDADRVMRRVYRRLATGPRKYIKRIQWFDVDGPHPMWALTSDGYLAAERVIDGGLEVPRDDIGVEYLEHHEHLISLFVGLIAPRVPNVSLIPTNKRKAALSGVFAKAYHPNIQWVLAGDRELPWKQQGPTRVEDRVIRPDAILVLPEHRRRFFVESELGTHSIESASKKKSGATMAKVDRYENYCSLLTGPAKGTFYQERFKDGFKPEVLFLVRTESRERSVTEALNVWRRTHVGPKCAFTVATLEKSLARLGPLVGVGQVASAEPKTAPPVAIQRPSGEVALSKAELEAFRMYVADAQSHFKTLRDRARAENRTPPLYPGEKSGAALVVHELLKRLRSKSSP